MTRWAIGIGVVGLLVWAGRPLTAALLCRDAVAGRYPAPQGGRAVVVAVRSCGATTGYATHVFLAFPGEPLLGRRGNVLVADTDHGNAPDAPAGGLPVRVEWADRDSVILHYDRRGRVFSAASRARGVTVTHLRIPAGGA